jgi:putative membrane protein
VRGTDRAGEIAGESVDKTGLPPEPRIDSPDDAEEDAEEANTLGLDLDRDTPIGSPCPPSNGLMALGVRRAASYPDDTTKRRLIEMMSSYFDGGNWLWMAGMMVLFWGGIIVLAVFAIRAFTGTRSNDQALDVLRRRLAGGEITQDEFEKTRKALRG